MHFTLRQIIFLIIFIPTVAQGQTNSKKIFLSDTNFYFLGGISLGYSPMQDSKFNQWLNTNGHKINNVYYLSFKSTLVFASKNHLAQGFDFDFYATGATTNYPLRFNLGYLVGKNFYCKKINIFLSGTFGCNLTKVNSFTNPIPSQYTTLNNPETIELKKRGIYVNPGLKILWDVKNGWCSGLDLGARIYLLNSNWTYNYSSNSHNTNIGDKPITGIPNLTTVDFYVNIFFGALPH